MSRGAKDGKMRIRPYVPSSHQAHSSKTLLDAFFPVQPILLSEEIQYLKLLLGK
jgi:hypothetical protein